MARLARVKSKDGFYHIIMRGINRQTLFEDEEDYFKFIDTLSHYKEVCGYKLYAYCLMGNHVHLLLKVEVEPLEMIMRRICSSYVFWYNKKYDRVGYLFQDRFKSEPVNDDPYFLTVLRYIFQNPLKAKLVKEVKDYTWTNYHDYVTNNKKTDIDFALKLFSRDRQKAIAAFIAYIKQDNQDQCLHIVQKQGLKDEEAREIIKKYCGVDYGTQLQTFDLKKRNAYLRVLKEEYGLSIRQLERLTGIGRGIIQRV